MAGWTLFPCIFVVVSRILGFFEVLRDPVLSFIAFRRIWKVYWSVVNSEDLYFPHLPNTAEVVDLPEELVQGSERSADELFVYRKRGLPAILLSSMSAVSRLFYLDTVLIARDTVADGASIPAFPSTELIVEEPEDDVDKWDWDFSHALNTCVFIGTKPCATYNRLHETGNELILHVSCHILRLLRLAEDGFPFWHSAKNMDTDLDKVNTKYRLGCAWSEATALSMECRGLRFCVLDLKGQVVAAIGENSVLSLTSPSNRDALDSALCWCTSVARKRESVECCLVYCITCGLKLLGQVISLVQPFVWFAPWNKQGAREPGRCQRPCSLAPYQKSKYSISLFCYLRW